MKRFTFRDPEGTIRWIPELLEDDTGMSGELIRGRMCELEDLLDGCSLARLRALAEADREGRCVVLYEAAKAIDSPWEELKQIEREREVAVKFCGKLFALCSPPKKWWPKLFRRLPVRAGDYMGSGYSFVDSANRIIDEFTETAEESLYHDVRLAAEEEAQRYKAQEERA